MVQFGARWYDAKTGRWLSKDPILLKGGLNLYVFCGNDPVNYCDPSGLCEDDATSTSTYSLGLVGVRGSFPFGGLADLSWVVDTDERLGLKFTLGVGCGVEAGVDTVVNDLINEFAGGIDSVEASDGTIYDQNGFGAEAHAGVIIGAAFDLDDPTFSGLEVGSIGGGAYKTGSLVLPLYDPNWKVVKKVKSWFE